MTERGLLWDPRSRRPPWKRPESWCVRRVIFKAAIQGNQGIGPEPKALRAMAFSVWLLAFSRWMVRPIGLIANSQSPTADAANPVVILFPWLDCPGLSSGLGAQERGSG